MLAKLAVKAMGIVRELCSDHAHDLSLRLIARLFPKQASNIPPASSSSPSLNETQWQLKL